MNDIETFIRDAALKRGIDPDIAVKVFKAEGGVDEYAAHGDFDTGDSWWPPQLHYGGAGYEKYGTVAGMGTGFTALTGWQPGDPRAWRDSIRYALNRAKAGGWSPWYGAAAAGVGQWDGINRAVPWDANAEPWDFEGGVDPVPTPTYDPNTPITPQSWDWDCAEQSAGWGITALGRHPSDAWLEQQMLADGIESRDVGLLDGSGAQLAGWIMRQYSDPSEGTPTLKASSAASVSFDDVRSVAGTTAVLLGGHRWGSAGHWSGVRGYDSANDVLLLANPADGYGNVHQTMTRQQFAAVAPFSMVVIRADGAPVPPPPPLPDPKAQAVELLKQALALLEA